MHLALAVSAALAACGAPGLRAQSPLGDDFDVRILPLFEDVCFDCHAGPRPKAGLDLERLAEIDDPLRAFLVLRRVRDRVHSREMPPDDWGALDDEEVGTLVGWARERVAAIVDRVDPDPGSVVIRRLTRVEYDNTVQDLFGVRTGLSDAFVPDDLAYGFANIGDAATFSGLHLEKYAAAAADIARQVIDLENPDDPTVRRFEAELMHTDSDSVRQRGRFAHVLSRATLSQTVSVPREGTYSLRVRACGEQAGGEPCRLRIAVDDGRLAEVEVPETPERPRVFEFPAELDAGRHRIGVAFLNDYYAPNAKDPRQRDRNLLVDWLEVVGPTDRPPIPEGTRWLAELVAEARASGRVRSLVRELLARAWRRPPTAMEVTRVCRVASDADASLELSVRTAVEAALVSPNFLLRVELPSGARTDDGIRELTSHELASRLSYFLWSTMPDARLRELAAQDRLREPDVLAAEVDRMLADGRSLALAENFATQWLETERLADATPDPQRFPAFSEDLREAMRQETVLVFDAVLRERRGVRVLLDADFTFVDENLARLYGIDGVRGRSFRRVPVPERRRAGVLGHASVHTVTSNATRTSPVKRGKWILQNLLDAPPPPPPPDAGVLEESEASTAKTMREALALHRRNASCAVCHARMDALGFALERFDPIGRYRETDAGAVVDARAELPGGRTVDGAVELARLLADDPAFVRTVLRKLFVYAIGRDTTGSDLLAIERLALSMPRSPTLPAMIHGIVGLDAFRKARTGR